MGNIHNKTGTRRGRYMRPREDQHRINTNIRSPEVRLVGDNVENRIYSIEEALKLARAEELDLVEISTKTDPPVCKIIEYSKYKYEQKKKKKLLKSKSQKIVVKEIRFTPTTGDHDFRFKKGHAERFLGEGAKVKVTVRFVGRQVAHKDQGEVLLLKFAQALEDICKVEQLPKLEGRKMSMIITPRK